MYYLFVENIHYKVISWMFKKMGIICIFLGGLGLLLGLAGFITAKVYFTNQATKKSNVLIENTLKDKEVSPEEEVIRITREIFERFKQLEPHHNVALRLRPYVSNQRLPEFLRFPDGVIETLVEEGMCDNAARMLHFVLKQMTCPL